MNKLDQALIGDDELANPALLDLPRGVRLVHVEAIAYAARHHTDGTISRAALRRLTDEPDAEAAAALLAAAGIWQQTNAGWSLDWSGQIAAEDAAHITVKNRAKWRGQKRHERDHHGDWCPKSCGVRSDSPADIPHDFSADSTRPLSDLTEPVRNVSVLNVSSEESARVRPEVQEVIDRVAQLTKTRVSAPTPKMAEKIGSLIDRHGAVRLIQTLEQDVSHHIALRPDDPPPVLRQLIFRAEDRLDPVH